MYPFLFYLPKNGRIFKTKVDRDTWIVKIAKHDYTLYESEWMCDDQLGKICLTPDVDLTHESHTFYSEQEALDFIKEWWKKQ